ncbi:DUF2332 domain-containing protein [Methylobacterium isbiliense]|uniref:DUF2332 domain-containing protein n=1 Tax=Methylobacterium isbiliense TaxID=315478 RepID=A0ABQ4SFW3_9HYPH|nr:DUF2332 family protein [Methylobacterium isbiliense]MDN3624519.1 DUF2332 family protein [Methylobacterium isbiliense]GJE02127.1 hypothetical protein GMJLKIPL_4071 [Methylobacterium isbiliense]
MTERVRHSFAVQAGHCERLGSPFTAMLLRLVAARLTGDTALGRRILGWPGDPEADALPLRLAGGLHALVRRGRLPDLAALYPPAAPDPAALWEALARAFATAADLDPWLDSAPQTNEVARSGVLMPGLMAVAAMTGSKPIVLWEIGASAGLNLVLDAYAYELGGRAAGRPGAGLHLAPDWTGPPPPEASVRIAARRGVDLNPLDVTDAQHRERLTAYVWPDQRARLARLEAALALAAADPPPLDRGDAVAWLAERLAAPPQAGQARVVQHSIALQYLPVQGRAQVAALLSEAGARATADTPLAWLAYEFEGGPAGLRLTLWPGGRTHRLATAHPHGQWVRWEGLPGSR